MGDAGVITGLPVKVLTAVMSGENHPPIVYFMRMGGHVKIGTTANIRNRIRALSLPWDALIGMVSGGKDVEAALHVRFDVHRLPGTEWFTYCAEIERFLGYRTPPVVAPVVATVTGLVPAPEPNRYSLAGASRDQIVPLSADALRQAKRRPGFPPAGPDGKWTAGELQYWYRNRPNAAAGNQ